jgi:uncharacterized phiE125 gp8 family phage protein
MPLKLITPRTLQPVTLAEAKLHLRVDTSDDDALITALIIAATDDAEALMQRAVLPQTWKLTLDSFGGASSWACIELQRPTVIAVTSVYYNQASDGVLTLLDPSAYQLAAASDYTARLLPAYGTYWPDLRDQAEAVQVTFTAGYADAAAVPELIKAWIKLRVAALYENRSAWTGGMKEAIQRNEFVDRLLDRYCIITC